MTAERESPSILVVDDDSEIRYSLQRVLSSNGYKVETAASGEEGIEKVKASKRDVIFVDVRMGGIGGIETLQRLRAIDPQAVVILMTAYGTTRTAIDAMKFGAFDYLIKPFDVEKVLQLTAAARNARLGLMAAARHQPILDSEDYREGIVGRSEPMQQVFKAIGQVAPSEATVLVSGESGTGKELVAKCLHRHSARASKQFMAINCAAIPENLIESELFGHERGAFTGATAQRIGCFEECDGGTIFLDEIGDMALPTQTKILRVLQEGEIQRVGGGGIIKVDVRVIAATNRDLEKMVAARAFREDLYYRLNVVRLRLPPLRERMEDLPLLVDYLLQKLEKAGKTRATKIAPEAFEMLMRHRWPGNVRELENVIYRSAVMAQSDVILARYLPAEIYSGEDAAMQEDSSRPPTEVPAAEPEQAGAPTGRGKEPEKHTAPVVFGSTEMDLSKLSDTLYQMLRREDGKAIMATIEEAMVRRALAETKGNQVRAATILGMTRTTLRKRIQELGIKI